VKPSFTTHESLKTQDKTRFVYFVLDEYLVTALVPSETACLASSPGRISRTLKLGVRKADISDRKSNLRGLDLSGRDGGLLGVGSELGGFSGNALEDICEIRIGSSRLKSDKTYH